YPTDDAQGAAAAIFLSSLGVGKAYLLNDPEVVGYGEPMVRTFRATARTKGLAVVGSTNWDSQATSYAALVDRVRRSGADGIFVAGLLGDNGAKLLQELRSRLGPRVSLVVPDGFLPVSDLFEAVGGPVARSIYVCFPGLTNDRLPAAPASLVGVIVDFSCTDPRGASDALDRRQALRPPRQRRVGAEDHRRPDEGACGVERRRARAHPRRRARHPAEALGHRRQA